VYDVANADGLRLRFVPDFTRFENVTEKNGGTNQQKFEIVASDANWLDGRHVRNKHAVSANYLSRACA
jgi:hypothetical protein